MASVYFSVCHSGHNFVCAGITKLAVKTKADLQKRGSMEPMEPPLVQIKGLFFKPAKDFFPLQLHYQY